MVKEVLPVKVTRESPGSDSVQLPGAYAPVKSARAVLEPKEAADRTHTKLSQRRFDAAKLNPVSITKASLFILWDASTSGLAVKFGLNL